MKDIREALKDYVGVVFLKNINNEFRFGLCRNGNIFVDKKYLQQEELKECIPILELSKYVDKWRK